MLRKTILFLVGLIGFAALIAGPLFLVKITQFKAMGEHGAKMAAGMPPTPVTSAAAVAQEWENAISATGSLAAVQGVTIGVETPGKVVKISFEPGASVKAGDVLIELDTSTERAQLAAAEATAALAKANLQRARDLRQNNTNSPAELDAANAEAKQAEAQAQAIRAVIDKKQVRAPFAGRLGLRQVNLGQIMREGDPVTTLQTLDPIYVNFSVPQQQLSVVQVGSAVRIRSDAAAGRIFEGKVNAISPEIDMVTRNIRVQATLNNSEERLRPGMFANVEVVLAEKTKALAIPVTAILYAPYGDSVFVIDEKKDEKSGQVSLILRQQFVRLSGARGDFVNVIDGLKPGEQIVTSGVFKLRPGMPVVIDNKLAPPVELAPKPKNA
jgi:membrane fusion protein (multidrug efflux system)